LIDNLILKIERGCASTERDNIYSKEIKYIKRGEEIIKMWVHTNTSYNFADEINIDSHIRFRANESDIEYDIVHSLKDFSQEINEYTITEFDDKVEHPYISFESSTISDEVRENEIYDENTKEFLFILMSKDLLKNNEWFKNLMHMVSIKDDATIYAENGVSGAFIETNGDRVELPKDTDKRSDD
jgi:hypothetical protein